MVDGWTRRANDSSNSISCLGTITKKAERLNLRTMVLAWLQRLDGIGPGQLREAWRGGKVKFLLTRLTRLWTQDFQMLSVL
jgi:hypothetical protein